MLNSEKNVVPLCSTVKKTLHRSAQQWRLTVAILKENVECWKNKWEMEDSKRKKLLLAYSDNVSELQTSWTNCLTVFCGAPVRSDLHEPQEATLLTSSFQKPHKTILMGARGQIGVNFVTPNSNIRLISHIFYYPAYCINQQAPTENNTSLLVALLGKHTVYTSKLRTAPSKPQGWYQHISVKYTIFPFVCCKRVKEHGARSKCVPNLCGKGQHMESSATSGTWTPVLYTYLRVYVRIS